MDKRLTLKLGLIIVIFALAGWSLYPPSETLRQGLDISGGTSLTYAVDTTGLSPEDQRTVAQRLVPILRKRIDPDNVQNLVIRPQGFSRIEIQMPMATEDVRRRRDSFDAAIESLMASNINLSLIERALTMPEPKRSETLAAFREGLSEHKASIINSFAAKYDKMQMVNKQQAELEERLAGLATQLREARISLETIQRQSQNWAKLEGQDLTDAIKAAITDADDAKIELAREYAKTYSQWAAVVDESADASASPLLGYRQARQLLEQLNVNMEYLRQGVLERPDGQARREAIEQLKASFPDRVEEITAVVTAFDQYRSIRGRLDDPEDLRRILKGVGVLEFRILPTVNDMDAGEIAIRKENLRTLGPKQASDNNFMWAEVEDAKELRPDFIFERFGEKVYVLATNSQDLTMLQSGAARTWQLRNAFPDRDSNNLPAIGFRFDEIGGGMFHRLTRNNTGRALAILLDNQVISAPNVQSAIRSRGIITGTFSSTQITDMVNKLNAGSLPARLIDPPISTRTIGPAIGQENRDAGIKAGLIGLGVVAVFMLIYYMTSGVVANIALFMNIIFVLSAMAFLGATFTLPGIAGIILTIGMAVDANVLINERIREEQQKGSTLRIAVRNGYQKAFSTILDANVTTFITALILYMVASEEIKGFAIVLMLGIIASMITALLVTRFIYEWLMVQRIISEKLRMLQLIGKPKINWMKVRPVFVAISAGLMIVGLLSFLSRDDKFDIEFTGGTSVTVTFNEEVVISRDEVHTTIKQVGERIDNPSIQAASVYAVGDTGRQYEITTLETNRAKAIVSFPQGAVPSTEQATASIRKAEDVFPAGDLTRLDLQFDGTQMAVTTSQINPGLIRQILTEAFPDAEVSQPVIDEVVNNAIIEAFGDRLQTDQNLEPRIVSIEVIDSAMLETEPQLTEYFGGVKIAFELGHATTAEQMDRRFKDLQYKPDMQGLVMNPHELLTATLDVPQVGVAYDSFVYVSRAPEAGFRELSAEELQAYHNNEETLITEAASLRASLPRVTQIDPSVGNQAKVMAIVAVTLALLAIVGYIWVRFGTARYGMAAIVALVHDVVITLGAVTACAYLAKTGIGAKLLLADFKINLEMIAAFLTIIGYSLNDTIVVFDRIRENRGKNGVVTSRLVNDSINQTLSRTLLTSFTTFLVVLVMYIWGGPGLRGFTFAMLVGIIVGTYSSIAIAAPILLLGQGKGGNTAQPSEKQTADKSA